MKAENVTGFTGTGLLLAAAALGCRGGYLSSLGPEYRTLEMRDLWIGAFLAIVGFALLMVALALSENPTPDGSRS